MIRTNLRGRMNAIMLVDEKACVIEPIWSYQTRDGAWFRISSVMFLLCMWLWHPEVDWSMRRPRLKGWLNSGMCSLINDIGVSYCSKMYGTEAIWICHARFDLGVETSVREFIVVCLFTAG